MATRGMMVRWSGFIFIQSDLKARRLPFHDFLLYKFLHLAERHKIRLGPVTVISELEANVKCPVQVGSVPVLVS